MIPVFLRDSKNSFHISIGEDGIVVAHANNGNVLAKLYARTPDPVDSNKISQLLNSDPSADFYIYLDNLDQSYVQRTLPAISPIGINKVAFDRLNKELPNRSFLKSLMQVGRLQAGRRDWVYTFISTSLDKPVSTWIDFLSDFANIICGIYFLPVEMSKLVEEIGKRASSQIIESNNQTLVDSLAKLNINTTERWQDKIFKKKSLSKKQGWDIIVTQNKTGGFRQCAYRNGKVVFSRLLNNINSPTPNVIAGNIEQEIANSVEYLLRLALGNDDFIRIFVVASSDILKGIRKEKLKGTECFLYTPFQISSLLGITNASTEKDKFSDPMILGLFSKNSFHPKITLHTELTKKVFNIVFSIRLGYSLMKALAPLMFLSSLFMLYKTYDWKVAISDLNSNLEGLKMQIQLKTQIIKDNESKIKEKIPMDQITEIVTLHRNINYLSSSPNEFILKLAEIIPDNIRLKSLMWNLKNPEIDKISATQSNGVFLSFEEISKNTAPEIYVSTSLKYINKSKSIDDLYRAFNSETSSIKEYFKDYSVSISSLPQTFNFGEVSKQIDINANFQKGLDKTNNSNLTETFETPENQLIEEFKLK